MYERQAYARPDGTLPVLGRPAHRQRRWWRRADRRPRRASPNGSASRSYTAARRPHLIVDGGRVGRRDRPPATTDRSSWRADSVVLAAGGFEADRRRAAGTSARLGARQGARHAAQHRRDARRRTAHRRGARPATGRAPTACSGTRGAQHNESNRRLTNRLTRQSYPLGIIVNRDGQRFVDEGADFRNYTYAKYGRLILEQPGSVAFQIFDARLRPLLRAEEYDMPGVSVAVADTIAGPGRPDRRRPGAGCPPPSPRSTRRSTPPSTVRPDDQGRPPSRTSMPPKSNWASPLDQPPFYAYAVTCGITFTFGGLRGDTDGRVLDEHGRADPRPVRLRRDARRPVQRQLPRRTGLAAGMVFGRRAGAAGVIRPVRASVGGQPEEGP